MARQHSARRKVGITVAAWFVGFIIFFPILWMVLTSFKSEVDAQMPVSEMRVMVGFSSLRSPGSEGGVRRRFSHSRSVYKEHTCKAAGQSESCSARRRFLLFAKFT